MFDRPDDQGTTHTKKLCICARGPVSIEISFAANM